MSEKTVEGPASTSGTGPSELNKSANSRSRRVGGAFVGCLGVIFVLWAMVNAICAMYGLITGYLWLPPVRNGQSIELFGAWARVVSAGILVFFGLIALLFYRNVRKRRRPKILGN